jgi:predicted enzyme related to lactoylglutathione lyase
MAGVLVFTTAPRHPAMAAFYRDVLHLTPRRDRDGFVSFAWGDVRLTIAVHERVTGGSRDPLRIMVNLAVDDVTAMHERLVGEGVDVVRPPQLERWGGTVCTVRDPDGNFIQLFELPPA